MSNRLSLLLALLTFLPTVAYAAENHVIEATNKFSWRSGEKESAGPSTGLIVEVRKGDTIEIRVSPESGTHGLMTIDKPGDQSPSNAPALVNACGTDDDETSKDAGLREVCEDGAPSQFGTDFEGKMTLEVLETFSADTNFWCTVHFELMWGVIKLAPGP